MLSCVVIATLTACSEQRATVELSPTGAVPAVDQRAGDVDEGYRHLTESAVVTCGLPRTAYDKMADGVERTLPDRVASSRNLPYFLTAHTNTDRVDIVTSNCLLCHATTLFGELVIGLGNETLDFTADQRVVSERAGALVEGELETAAWRKWADRVAAIAPYMRTDTVGVNPANNLTLALIAHRNPETLAWSDDPVVQPPPTEPLPVSVPPWWRMKKKNALFYTTEGREDHARLMMTAALLCTDSVDEARRIDAFAPHIRAFIADIAPPPYPFAIDTALAKTGQTIFEANCSRCHGLYGPSPEYPNLVVPLAEIGTDPELALRSTEQSDRFIDWYNASFFGEIAKIAPAPGYIAPPLDGVWATAPFLHNGSVPTIQALLDSTIRPAFWKPNLEREVFDESALGFEVEVVDYGKTGVAKNESKFIYDTTQKGYSNSGHTFGDHLESAERSAVIEYLKTL